jgi:hypothetical protein
MMQVIGPSRKEAVPVGGRVQKRNDRRPHAPMQRCSAMSRQVEADRAAVQAQRCVAFASAERTVLAVTLQGE